MEIQLIIRAPNQNIEDQVINCNTDWTVWELKDHLSEVYPNRPIAQEQKLIYSGRLLHDHLQLKDVIRHEDLQSNVHILHLVWNGNNYHLSSEQIPSSSQYLPNESVSVQFSESNEGSVATSENVPRHRFNSPTPQEDDFHVQFQQMPANTLPLYVNDPQMISQMAVIQQMYAQYMSQYWQNMNVTGATGNAPFMPLIPNVQPLQNNPNNVPPEPMQQPANQRNNVPAVQIEDEFARDWLDQIFLYFRFLILLCIVYFYTTPERFMIVIIFVVIAFLYHEGWFVRHGIAEAVMGQRNRGHVEPNPNVANNANDRLSANENEEQDAHELEAAMDGEDPPHAQNPDAANNNNNQVFSPLNFLATFFSSLIPETPPPVNIN